MDLASTIIDLQPDGSARPVEVTDTFWDDVLAGRRNDLDGLTVGAFDYAADWDGWERHPAGDEVVIAIAGSFTLVLEDGTRTTLATGHAAVVPRGAWHRAEVAEPSRAIHITPGAGTEHRALGG